MAHLSKTVNFFLNRYNFRACEVTTRGTVDTRKSEGYARAMEQEEIARLTVEEVKARLDRGDALILVDVRKESVYARSHIRGAICVPVTDVESRLDQLPAVKHLVFY